MQVLRDIAATGRTVIGESLHLVGVLAKFIATIHQPRSDICQLADNVTLLAKGGLIAVCVSIVFRVVHLLLVYWTPLRSNSLLLLHWSSYAFRILQSSRSPTRPRLCGPASFAVRYLARTRKRPDIQVEDEAEQRIR